MRVKAITVFGLILIFSLLICCSAFSASIFTVVGTVRNADDTMAATGLEVVVSNENRNLSVTTTLGKQEAGRYSVVFIDMENKTVAAEGDILNVTVKDTQKDHGSQTHKLTADDIAKARAIINFTLEPPEMHYFISSPSDSKKRGGVIIPKEMFPEGKGAVIPIYVPSVIDGSNAIREDNGWKTIKEIKRSKLNFEWEKLITGFTPAGADTPTGAAFSFIAELIEALHNAISISACKITLQKDSEGNLRAIIQVGDPDSRTFIRKYAGEKWVPFAESFWLVRAVLSEQIAKTFGLEPDDFPIKHYTMTVDIDSSHKNDEYIGYLSLFQDNKIIVTPKIYLRDRLQILRIYEVIIPYKKEVVIDLTGDGFISFMEGPVEPGFVKMLSPSVSESKSVIIVQGQSPIKLRVYDSKGNVTGLVNGEVKEEIPNSMYNKENKAVMIFSPLDSYRYEVVGIDEGTYELTITSVKNGEATTFTATGVPTSANAVHQYTVDWDALKRGSATALSTKEGEEEAVTVQMDSDGDGTFEETINTGATFTAREEKPWDINSDGIVDIFDFTIVGKHFGETGEGILGDVNKDSVVDIVDLMLVGSHFGE